MHIQPLMELPMTERVNVPPIPPSRLRLMFESILRGPEILLYLMTKEAIEAMIAATERGEPAVVGVSEGLIKRFGEGAFSDAKRPEYDYAKRAVGSAIRWLMEANNYEIEVQGRKTPADKLFSTGTKYRKRWVPTFNGPDGTLGNPHPGADTISRLVSGLDSGELRLLIDAAQNELTRLARMQPSEGE